jgi:alpha-ribazole phosphatase
MHQPTTNGESFPEMYARVASFFDELRQHDYERVAIFAHGGVLICAGIYAGLYAADEHAFEHITPYGGVIEIEL